MKNYFIKSLCIIARNKFVLNNEEEFMLYTKGSEVKDLLLGVLHILLTVAWLGLFISSINTGLEVKDDTKATLIIIGATLLMQLILLMMMYRKIQNIFKNQKVEEHKRLYILTLIFLLVSANPYKETLYLFILEDKSKYLFSMEFLMVSIFFIAVFMLIAFIFVLPLFALGELFEKGKNFISYDGLDAGKEPKPIKGMKGFSSTRFGFIVDFVCKRLKYFCTQCV